MNASENGMKAAAAVKAEILKVSPEFIEVGYRGKAYRLNFDRYPWFRYCTLSEIFNVRASAGGLHWPDADIDLEVAFIDNPPERMSDMTLANWLRWRRNRRQVEGGRKGGRSASPVKRRTAAENGRKGGRPRKSHGDLISSNPRANAT